MNSKSNSIKVKGGMTRKDTLGQSMNSFDKKSSIAGTSNPFGRPPRVNASNNINGDELFKIHGAEGGFSCKINCAACRF